MNYGHQIGVIVYGNNAHSNWAQWHINSERAKGHVVILCSGFARVHLPR